MLTQPHFMKHISFQDRCYLDNTRFNDGITIVGSTRITDMGWNYLYSSNIDHMLDYVRNLVKPAIVFFSSASEKEKILAAYPNAGIHTELWLHLVSPICHDTSKPFDRIEEVRLPSPSNEFLQVFSNIFDPASVGEQFVASFNRQYIQSLKFATMNPQCDSCHVIGWLHDSPAAVASIYHDGSFGCLYNVGTRYNMQKQGMGSAISIHAVNLAFAAGVTCVFLQCEAGGHVEAMYRSLGFRNVTDEAGFACIPNA